MRVEQREIKTKQSNMLGNISEIIKNKFTTYRGILIVNNCLIIVPQRKK